MLYLFLQIAVKALSGLLALFALTSAGALSLRKVRVSALVRLKKGVLLALLICAVVATDWAQKGGSRAPVRSPSPSGAPMVVSDDGEGSSPTPTNLQFTAIGVSSNAVRLSLAWPAGFLMGGDRLDIFAALDLSCPDDLLPAGDISGTGWRWCAGHIVADGSTNVTLAVNALVNGDLPPMQFFRAVVDPLPPVRDADGDGLADAVDPEPQIAGADAHGANAEWYGVVCSNVFMKAAAGEPTGSAVTLPNGETVHFRPDVNERAYYFVEVVAERGPAEVRFRTDTPGRLGSPVVLARTGETCLVPLLIGAEYAVTSAVPISLCAPDAAYAEIVTNGVAGHTVKWPLEFVDIEDSPGVHVMDVRPYDPGGTFAWNRGTVGTRHAVPRLATSAADGGGCPYTALASTVEFGCNGSDGCACGGCTVYATYGLEGNTFYGGSVACGCAPPEEHPDEPPHEEPEIPYISPHVDVWFSQSAVIFEDEYQNEVGGEIIPRRSTTTCLCVYAEAGSENAEFVFDSLNLEKLALVEGQEALPSAMTLGPGGVYYAEFVCEGAEASESECDVTVDAYIENESGDFDEWTDSLTVVEVEIKPQELAPANRSDHRHTFGVYELVDLIHKPAIGSVEWTLQGGGNTEDSEEGYVEAGIGGGYMLRCPLYNNGATLKVSCGGADLYFPEVRFVEPQGVEARNAVGHKGVYLTNICGASMGFDMYVTPMTVSFGQIAIEEIPSEDILFDLSTCSGYFMSDPPGRKSHTYEMGAGRWNEVLPSNYFATDTVATGMLLAVDQDGTMSWYIPMGWHRKGAVQGGERHLPFREFAPHTYWQDFFVFENGDSMVQKHGHWCWRNLQDDVWLDGREVQ